MYNEQCTSWQLAVGSWQLAVRKGVAMKQ